MSLCRLWPWVLTGGRTVMTTLIGNHAPAEIIDHRQRYVHMSMADNSP